MMTGAANFVMSGSRFTATLPNPKPVHPMMRGMGMGGMGGGFASLSF